MKEHKQVVYGVVVEANRNPCFFKTQQDAERYRVIKKRDPRYSPVRAYEKKPPGGGETFNV